ncbi:MAG: formyltransferase family protein [Candidatus Margulisiibacteriota bacterium]
MKTVWLSANKLGLELLKEAIKVKGFDLNAVITLDQTAATIMYDGVPAKSWQNFGVKVHQVSEINKEKALLKELAPDLVVMCGWRQVVDGEVLKIPPRGVIGFHPTLLPFGRGPAPIINSILTGVRESGLTMFYPGTGLDDGDIIAQEKFKIGEVDDAATVYKKVIRAGKKIIRQYLPLIIAGQASRTPQDGREAVVFKKPKLADNRIDLEKESLNDIYAKIKALSKPYKGAYLEKDGKKLIIWQAELLTT